MTDRSDRSTSPAIDGAPADVFDTPRDVLDRDDLDYQSKLDILQRWQADIRDRETGDERDDRLEDVAEAIEQLQANVTVDPDEPKGAPSGKGYRPKG